MFKSSLGYEVGWNVFKSTEKPYGLHRICSRDQLASYLGKLFKLLFFIKQILVFVKTGTTFRFVPSTTDSEEQFVLMQTRKGRY